MGEIEVTAIVRGGLLREGQVFYSPLEDLGARPMPCERVVYDRVRAGGPRVVSGNVLYWPEDCYTDRLSAMAEARKALVSDHAYHADRIKAVEGQLFVLEAELAAALAGGWEAPTPDGPCVVREDDGEAD